MSSVFHFTPSPNSSIELEHASPHRSTPGTLSACPVSLSWSLHPPVWSGKVVLWTSHRWYLGVTWYFSSPPMGGISSLSPNSSMSGLLSHHGRALPSAATQESWEANFWDLSRLCENRLILLLHLADNLARYRTSDWRLFALKFGGKSSTSCMFHYCSWEVRVLILCKGPTFLSLKTLKKMSFIHRLYQIINMFWNGSFFLYMALNAPSWWKFMSFNFESVFYIILL